MTDRSDRARRRLPPRAAQALQQLFRGLRRLRDIFHLGSGRTYTDFDEGAGRSSGFLSDVFRGKERMLCDRLFALLDSADQDPADFFGWAFPIWEPKAMTGFLLSCKEPVRTTSLLESRDELLAWGKALEVSEDGGDFLADPGHLLKVLATDPKQAKELACAWLGVPLRLRPAALAPEAAERLCRVLVPLGHILRMRGDRNTAAEVLDLAFRIEARLGNKSVRAFIYRISAYLLSDLGHPEFAVIFASRASELCRQADDRLGLGRSTFIEAEMLRRSGRFETATAYFHLALLLLPSTATDFLVNVRICAAWAYLQLDQPVRSLRELEEAEKLVPAPEGMIRGSLLQVRAMAASQADQPAEADRLFAQSAEVIMEAGNSLDVAILEVTHMLHLVRFGRWPEVTAKVERLPALSASLAGNSPGEAALLEVARHALRGELVASMLQNLLETLRRQRTSAL